MTELDDLLSGVRANPDDDAPRLIVADWLEEHGQDERAEFVRLQVRLSHWIPDLVEREQAQARETQLLQRHQAEWLGSLRTRPDTICRFLRGTIHVVYSADKRFVLRPWVTSVRAHDNNDLQPTALVLHENEQRFRNGLGMWLQHIPAGTFRMGSTPASASYNEDEKQRIITISKPFAFGTFPVTVGQYLTLVPNADRANAPDNEIPSAPVEAVSWEDAVAFCEKLSDLPSERAAGRRYRLPTEAEWEYACRAGTRTEFNFGDQYDPMLANCNNDYERVLPVGCFDPNGFGLYDLHGQVREWCADWYVVNLSKYSPTNPKGPKQPGERGPVRVLRGGSWGTTSPVYCRSAYRVYSELSARARGIGFRVACDFRTKR